jgi:hypothetical protein
MKLKKLILILISCFTLASCATFDPKRHYDGYQSINQIPISNKDSSKVYILHQPVEGLAHPMVAIVYADGKYVGRTFPGLMLLHETNNSKVNLDVYSNTWCADEDYKIYGSGKINIDIKKGDDVYLVVTESRGTFEVPKSLIFAYIFCEQVKSDKSAFHKIRKVSKDAWMELSKSGSSSPDAFLGTYKYKDEELKATREYWKKYYQNK